MHSTAALWDVAVPSLPGPLRGVSMAGFIDHAASPVDLDMVPYPAVTIALDLGDGILAVEDGTGGRQHGTAVVGLGAGGVRTHNQGIECLQIRLSPLVAHAVLGPPAELVSLDDLWGREAARVREQLRDTASWDNRFALAATALARRYAAGRPVAPELRFVWGELVRTTGAVRIEDLAAETGWSRKRLWSRFRTQLGLTPKRAAQLIRFDHAAHRLAAGRRPSQVAAESGYADQSHLNRDTATFAGTTPTAVAEAAWLTIDEIAWARPAYLQPGPAPCPAAVSCLSGSSQGMCKRGHDMILKP
ncbi:helix-turn-helix domain-containing protein [Kitasatospora sp. NPDC096077]|uniref:helix-turn-helix domain-containing protein n=1 Tax=Kitasatospora sp. NPDC096077 TaxID=3155544 RepID=UPI003316E1B6